MSLPVGKVAIPALAAAAFTPKQTMTKKHSSSQMESVKERLTITTTEHKSVSAKRFTDTVLIYSKELSTLCTLAPLSVRLYMVCVGQTEVLVSRG